MKQKHEFYLKSKKSLPIANDPSSSSSDEDEQPKQANSESVDTPASESIDTSADSKSERDQHEDEESSGDEQENGEESLGQSVTSGDSKSQRDQHEDEVSSGQSEDEQENGEESLGQSVTSGDSKSESDQQEGSGQSEDKQVNGEESLRQSVDEHEESFGEESKRLVQVATEEAVAQDGMECRKRPAAEIDELSRKKAKKEDNNNSKNPRSTRVWSEDDEITILEGMIRFKKEKGVEPLSNIDAFHEFIRMSLISNANSNNQLYDKIRKLKKKYVGDTNAKEKAFSGHQNKCLELSNVVWGGESTNKREIGNGTKTVMGNKKGEIADECRFGTRTSTVMKKKGVIADDATTSGPVIDVCQIFQSHLGCPTYEEILKAAFDLSKGNHEIKAKMVKLKIQELEVVVKRAQLMKELTELVLKAVKSSKG